MRILVTGGSGDVGRSLVERLVEEGFSVRVIGRRRDVSFPGAEYRRCDINDYAALYQACDGIDRIVHLSALRAPEKGTPEDIFKVNATGTFNVYQAAAERGIQRVVNASSINALGLFYGVKPAAVQTLPVDESHPTYSTDAYSFSKNETESIGDYFARREGISGASLRIPGVYDATAETLGHFKNSIARARALLDRFDETRLRELEIKIDHFRSLRTFETKPTDSGARNIRPILDDDEAHIFFLMTNLCTNLDTRDSARAFELALTSPYDGHHALFVNDDHNSLGLPSIEIARRLYPHAKIDEAKLPDTASLITIDRAKSLFGFSPEFSLSRFF